VARCLLIGCGCRGQQLARELVDRGHAVRGTTRDPARMSAIKAAGAEPVLADPDRVVTLAPAFEHIAVAGLLLGSAADPAVHGSRLEMMLTRLVDTTMRGIVYETRGRAGPDLLRGGAERVASFCEDARIPYALLDADPTDPQAWVSSAAAAVERVLER
jgi:predicted dinucleotide-binding enzyme